jgi:hypothetical protein
MSDAVEKIEHRGYTIEVCPDPDPMDPRKEFDNLGTMVCFHRRYELGDKLDLRAEDFRGWDEVEEHLRKSLGAVIVLPLYLYDHGGLRMKVGSFQGHLPQGHAEFDSGQVGFIYITADKIREEFGDSKSLEEVADYLRSEVDLYDDFLSGSVYGYRILDPNGEEVDACVGFYGYDHEKSGLLGSARDEIDAVIAHEEKLYGIQQKLQL